MAAGMWIGATAMSRKESETFRFGTLQTLGINKVILNIYDDSAYNVSAWPMVDICHARGMKGLFWKRCLWYRYEWHSFDYLWLFDMDIVPHATFSLAAVEDWFRNTSSSIVQPSIRPARPGGRMSDHVDLNFDKMGECVAKCARIEVMTPIFQMHAWRDFYASVLGNIPDNLLTISDRGLDKAFTGVAHMNGKNTLVLRDVSVVHRDTRSYDKLYRKMSGHGRPHGNLWLSLLDAFSNTILANPVYAIELFLWRHNGSVMKAAECHEKESCFRHSLL